MGRNDGLLDSTIVEFGRIVMQTKSSSEVIHVRDQMSIESYRPSIDEERLGYGCAYFIGRALVCDEKPLIEHKSHYYLFDSNNKVVKVGASIPCDESVKYIADCEFVNRYSTVFDLGNVFQWTHLIDFHIWMESIIDLQPKLKYRNLGCTTFATPVSPVDAKHEIRSSWFVTTIRHIHINMKLCIPSEFGEIEANPYELVATVKSGKSTYFVAIEEHELTKGFYALARDHNLGKNYTLLLASVGNLLFDLFVFNEEGSRVKYEWSTIEPIKQLNGSSAPIGNRNGCSLVTSYLPAKFRASSYGNQFCKILRRLDLQRMELPDVFKNTANVKPLRQITLITKAKRWDVKYSNGCFEGEGWTLFVATHRLESGNILVFSSATNHMLHTMIFAKNGCECTYSWY